MQPHKRGKQKGRFHEQRFSFSDVSIRRRKCERKRHHQRRNNLAFSKGHGRAVWRTASGHQQTSEKHLCRR